jgi:hypothetical protein
MAKTEPVMVNTKNTLSNKNTQYILNTSSSCSFSTTELPHLIIKRNKYGKIAINITKDKLGRKPSNQLYKSAFLLTYRTKDVKNCTLDNVSRFVKADIKVTGILQNINNSSNTIAVTTRLICLSSLRNTIKNVRFKLKIELNAY